MGELAIPRFGSVHASDPDYDPLLVRIGPRLDILLNGRPTSKVIAYNQDEGWVRRYLTGDDGKIILPGAAESLIREEKLIGRVTVRWR